jgi:hypothetical protein
VPVRERLEKCWVLVLLTFPSVAAHRGNFSGFVGELNTTLKDVFFRVHTTKREDTGAAVYGLVRGKRTHVSAHFFISHS